MFALMQTGDLEMVYGGINTFAWIKGGEAYEITAIPFLFKDYDHMRRSLQADFFKPIQEKAEKDTEDQDRQHQRRHGAARPLDPRQAGRQGRRLQGPQDPDRRQPRPCCGRCRPSGAMPQQIAFCRAVHGAQDRRRRRAGKRRHRRGERQPVRGAEVLHQDRLHPRHRDLLHGRRQVGQAARRRQRTHLQGHRGGGQSRDRAHAETARRSLRQALRRR